MNEERVKNGSGGEKEEAARQGQRSLSRMRKEMRKKGKEASKSSTGRRKGRWNWVGRGGRVKKGIGE